MASFLWDHTVHYVNNLDRAIDIFKENGLIAFHGGSHTDWGTYNALSYFGLTYIEFLGIEDEDLVEKTDTTNVIVKEAPVFLPENEGFGRIALRTNDIDAVYEALKEKGLDLNPIIDGRRMNAQGQLIEWRMMTINGDFQGILYPFIIQWNGNDEERLSAMKKSGVIQPHPAGETTIEKAVFIANDPEAVSSHWNTLFQLEKAGENTLKIGSQFFEFKQGPSSGMKQIVFRTNGHLQGKSFKIGNGEYLFK